MNYVGTVFVVKEPCNSRNPWGPLSELSGACLPVLEKNDTGDCLCYMTDKGLVDVDHTDVRSFIPRTDPLNTIMKDFTTLFNSVMKG